MNKTALGLAALCLTFAGLVAAADDPAPMPQTRGMQGMDPKAHDTAPDGKPTMKCMRKPGTEAMEHEPKDHPMADTRGMKGMDPAQHMEKCMSSDQPAAPKAGPHKHKVPGQG